ncbi:MAG TPA: C25 family cysteine peptidase [Roseiflexaceae bacterium]|nr:C25 family cysteine peptidase [Roseiflexaceae bacterium]
MIRPATIVRITILIAALALLVPTRTAEAAALRISERGGGVLIEWSGGTAAGWSTATLGGLELPAQIVALRGGTAAPAIERLESVSWRGALTPARLERPPLPAGLMAGAEQAAQVAGLPAAPVTVLRQGRMRGVPITVLALSPLFAPDGAPRLAGRVRAFVPGATLLRGAAAELLAGDAPFLSDAPAPSNPALGGPAWRVRVSQGGVQRLSAARLAAAGVDMADPARLHLRRAGAALALELREGELRFYAPPPGDRWSATDDYWLTVESLPGARMQTRDAAPVHGAPVRSTAVERGVWRRPALYDPGRPGPSGDRWFAGRLTGAAGEAPITATLTLSPSLPLATGSVTLTIAGLAYTSRQHLLKIAAPGAAVETSWSGAGLWERSVVLPNSASTFALSRPPADPPDTLAPDTIAWERPVRLLFGGAGGSFVGVAGRWVYQLSGPPAGAMLYDISDPRAPQILVPTGDAFLDDSPVPRSYLLAGPGTLAEPALTLVVAPDLGTPAEALYIAPAELHAALAPLVEWRRAQGRSVRVIDVQALYDAWSYGEVDPEAIRSFLRYTAARWTPTPAAVTLVGDGSFDPRNYTGRNSVDLIPPYLATVDPWLGQTACETCYVQLDGDSPAADKADALPDMQIGRLPVRSAAQLSGVVAKILSYERAAPGGLWRSRNLFVADNYREPDGTRDAAGDFAAWSDEGVGQQPRGVQVGRVYYDPYGRDSAGQPLGQPWRFPDERRAYAEVLAALNAGAGLVNYTGHSSEWQWATTALDSPQNYLLGLYDPDTLTNGERLSIVLELTCLTAAFHTPAFSGTTLDERWLLASGGAVAVWGPTGLGVARSHSLLQRGFYKALWSGPPQRSPLGTLAAAGYLEVFGQADQVGVYPIRTFALLGDPLTPARVAPIQPIYAPVVVK